MADPSVFGEIAGYPVKRSFADRVAVQKAGLHRHRQAGISGNVNEGADAIVVSGGYRDDRDYGDEILYTGQGGRDPDTGKQVEDQTFTRGNLALVRSEEQGFPVRVIRGANGDPAYSPSSGYRYDGLYRVERHWTEASSDGPLIYRYWLVKEDNDAPWEAPATGPAGSKAPVRNQVTTQRIVRSTAVTQAVKRWHDFHCQVCDVRIEAASGPYAEGAHIQPLGIPHNGPDVTSNVLCLCPNDHVRFDKGVIFVDSSGDVRRVSNGQSLGPLRTVSAHTVDATTLKYHRQHIAGQP